MTMTEKIKKRMLLALDGSDNSLEVVRYVAKIPALREMSTVLFNVRSAIPEGYWDLEKNGLASWRIGEARIWEEEHDRVIQGCIQKAEKILEVAGFSRDAVVIKIHNRKQGFARDIAKEAERGYAGVLVGRKGKSNLKDLVLGGISSKLIEIVDSIPIIVVGEDPSAGSVLIALDGSKNADRGVAYVGQVLGKSDFAVRFVHVIRGDNPEYVTESETMINRVFEECKTTLSAYGFHPDRISTKVITGVASRAAAIAEEARRGAYGTIVVGRRGLSRVRDFFMGRVCNKLIHLAKHHAVWVVN